MSERTGAAARTAVAVAAALLGVGVVSLALLVAGMRWKLPAVLTPSRHNRLLDRTAIRTRADWVRNVLASGSATVVTRGDRVDVDRPSIVATADVEGQIPAKTLRTLRLFGVNQCLHLEKS